MDVKGGYPWWTVRNGLLRDYPPLLADGECDVAVIGAGITGALIARALVEAGLETIVLDRRNVGWGSTAASTALLQYEIDTELLQLSKLVGEQHALAAYKASEAALSELRRSHKTLATSAGARRRAFTSQVRAAMRGGCARSSRRGGMPGSTWRGWTNQRGANASALSHPLRSCRARLRAWTRIASRSTCWRNWAQKACAFTIAAK